MVPAFYISACVLCCFIFFSSINTYTITFIHQITPEAVWPGDNNACGNTMTHIGEGLDDTRKEFKEKVFTKNLSNVTYVIMECRPCLNENKIGNTVTNK